MVLDVWMFFFVCGLPLTFLFLSDFLCSLCNILWVKTNTKAIGPRYSPPAMFEKSPPRFQPAFVAF